MTVKTAAAILLSLQAVLLFQSVSASRTKPELFPDPEMLHYLENLYQRVKELRRPLVEGEMNLLPEHVQGFANSVMCFSGKMGLAALSMIQNELDTGLVRFLKGAS